MTKCYNEDFPPNNQTKRRMLLIYLEMEKAASVKFDAEVDRLARLSGFDRPSTVGVLRVAFDVHDAVEVCVADVHRHLHAVGQAVDDDVGAGEVSFDDWRWRNGNCKHNITVTFNVQA